MLDPTSQAILILCSVAFFVAWLYTMAGPYLAVPVCQSGWKAYQQAEYARAIRWYRWGVRLSHSDGRALYGLGLCLYAGGRRDLAIVELYRALREDSGLVEARRLLCQLLAADGKYEPAISEARETIRLHPMDHLANRTCGWAYLAMDNPIAARAYLSVVARHYPDDSEAAVLLASALYELGETDALYEEMTALTAREPDCHLGRFFLAAACAARDDYARAAELSRGLVADSGFQSSQHFILALNNLGHYLNECGEAVEAEGPLRRALAIDSERGYVRGNLARSLALQGRLDEAEEEYIAALRLDPDGACALQNYGELLAKRGHFDKAVLQLRRARELDPDGRWAKRAAKLLSEAEAQAATR